MGGEEEARDYNHVSHSGSGSDHLLMVPKGGDIFSSQSLI